MKGFLSKIWFPAAVAGAIALQMAASDKGVDMDDTLVGLEISIPVQDTVKYRHDGYKKGWTDEEKGLKTVIDDSLLTDDVVFEDEDLEELDSMTRRFGPRPAGLDTIVAPDSLLAIDTFRYKYFPALSDSLCHMYVRDTLIAFGDSLDWPRLDSLYAADSAAFAQAAYDAWYATLDRKGRKKADMERMLPIRKARMDSIQAAKDSIKDYKDSVLEATPRILETFAFKDTVTHQRVIRWTHDRDFHDLRLQEPDTSYNYRFNDYPFLREDVGGTWLGVAGSPVQTFDYTKRQATDGAIFYDAQQPWSYSPESLTMFNTKTPYTELAYWGTILAGTSKESNNLHILTTQNISPSLNFCLRYDRFGGEGMLENEATTNKNTAAAVNYLGRRYLMHAGYIYNMVSREESGGVVDNYWIRDTTVDAREVATVLSGAKSKIKKNTIFLDQQYRIPFTFIEKWQERKHQPDSTGLGEDAELPELEEAPEDSDEDTSDEEPAEEEPKVSETQKDITTAFIGHSSELSIYKRIYDDNITSTEGKELYGNVFNYNPTTSHDSLRVLKFDNKFFIRLQPWSEDGVVSKLDVGIGEKLLNYYTFDASFLKKPSNYNWNSTYAYAGIQGKIRKAVEWDAKAHLGFIGDEAGDMDVSANARLTIYPFRRYRTSPMIFGAHFETSLNEPDYYVQHMYTNHYAWNNDFSKISDTRVQGYFSIPRWEVSGSAGYTLLANNIYYDAAGMACQNTSAMSILTASLSKDLRIWKLHFDHRVLVQVSSNQEVVPLPLVAVNARYYIQLGVGDAKGGTVKPLYIQAGVNALYNTSWYMPGWNPEIGVFHNQSDNKYGGIPYIDAFINMQWKRACIFIKYENAGYGWLTEKNDYFSADHYIRTQHALKLGMYWPFYTQPGKAKGSIPGAPAEGGHQH